MNIKTVTITQSWDRVVCKGYPVIFSRLFNCVESSNERGCSRFFRFSNQKIEVLGAPVWDYLFKKEGLLSRKFFLKKINLNPNKPTVYYPLSSAFWHDELILNLRIIRESLNKNKINKNLQFILRVHPYYWRDEKLRKELFKELETLKRFKNIHINYNKIVGEKNSYFLKEDDHFFLKKLLSSFESLSFCYFIIYDGGNFLQYSCTKFYIWKMETTR